MIVYEKKGAKHMFIYKYYRPNSYSFDSVRNCQICFNYMGNFSDKNEGRFWIKSNEQDTESLGDSLMERAETLLADRVSEDYTNVIRLKFRVFSATDSMRYRYMWDEYAEKGTGFCVAYDDADLEACSSDFRSICYQECKEPDGLFKNSGFSVEELKEKVYTLLFTKFTEPGIENGKKVFYKKEHEIRYLKILADGEIENITGAVYINEAFSEKTKKFAYHYDPITKKCYKAVKLFFAIAKAKKIFAGVNMSDENLKEIATISKNLSIPLVLIKDEDLVDEQ